jgi:Flp pilus assembly protein TadG
MTARPGLLRRLVTPRRGDDRGAVAILVAVLVTVFFGLAALVVDLGFAQDQTRKAQNAADAGALAGATCMASLTSGCNSVAAATLKARSYITANGWDGAGSTIDVDTTALTVAVTLPARQSPTFFAGALGSRNASVARSATATWNGAGSGCSLCVLNDVTVSANSDLRMDQGDLLVNGNLALGPMAGVVNTGGQFYVNGNVTGYVAGQTLLQDITGVLLPATVPKTGAITAPVVDVSAALGQRVTAPSAPACTPGTYALLDACTTLAPGVYVVTGATSFTRAGATTIQATGVSFVLACSRTTGAVTRSSACASGEPGGSIEVGGRTTLNLSVPSPPVYAGICFGLAIVSDPNNTGQLWVHGTNAQLNVTGSIYLRSGTLNYAGGPDLTVAGNIIVGQYLASGNPGILHALGCGPASGGGGGGIHLLR